MGKRICTRLMASSDGNAIVLGKAVKPLFET